MFLDSSQVTAVYHCYTLHYTTLAISYILKMQTYIQISEPQVGKSGQLRHITLQCSWIPPQDGETCVTLAGMRLFTSVNTMSIGLRIIHTNTKVDRKVSAKHT